MVKIGDSTGFGQIGFSIFWSIHLRAMRYLNGHHSMELIVMSQIHQAKVTFAQHLFDSIASNRIRRVLSFNKRFAREQRRGFICTWNVLQLGQLTFQIIQQLRLFTTQFFGRKNMAGRFFLFPLCNYRKDS